MKKTLEFLQPVAFQIETTDDKIGVHEHFPVFALVGNQGVHIPLPTYDFHRRIVSRCDGGGKCVSHQELWKISL